MVVLKSEPFKPAKCSTRILAGQGLAQVYRLERTIQCWRSGKCYRTSCEVEFGITSLTRQKANPSRLLENPPCALGD